MQTITVLEESKLVDTELLGLYAILLGLLAAAGTLDAASELLRAVPHFSDDRALTLLSLLQLMERSTWPRARAG